MPRVRERCGRQEAMDKTRYSESLSAFCEPSHRFQDGRCAARCPRPAVVTTRRAGMLLRSSASCHMPSRWPLTPHAASPAKRTCSSAVQPSVVAITKAAHGSSPRPRRTAAATVSAPPSSMAAKSSVGAATTNAATMDGRTVHVATHSRGVKSLDARCE